jgi:hypothetical protein
MAWAAPKAFRGWEAAVPSLEFSCHRAHEEGINDGSLKVLLPGMGGLLPLARVGSWVHAHVFLALARCPRNEPVDQARATGLTTGGCPQLTAGGSDHGR